jgi:hypothetical protein
MEVKTVRDMLMLKQVPLWLQLLSQLGLHTLHRLFLVTMLLLLSKCRLSKLMVLKGLQCNLMRFKMGLMLFQLLLLPWLKFNNQRLDFKDKLDNFLEVQIGECL